MKSPKWPGVSLNFLFNRIIVMFPGGNIYPPEQRLLGLQVIRSWEQKTEFTNGLLGIIIVSDTSE